MLGRHVPYASSRAVNQQPAPSNQQPGLPCLAAENIPRKTRLTPIYGVIFVTSDAKIITCYGTSPLPPLPFTTAHLNDAVHWSSAPSRVWTYTLGGYQVIKKWLTYRAKNVLGRDLEPKKARYITQVTRRITAILLMEPELDANYEVVKVSTTR